MGIVGLQAANRFGYGVGYILQKLSIYKYFTLSDYVHNVVN